MAGWVASVARDVVHDKEGGGLALVDKLCIGLLLRLEPLHLELCLSLLLLLVLVATDREVNRLIIVIHDSLHVRGLELVDLTNGKRIASRRLGEWVRSSRSGEWISTSGLTARGRGCWRSKLRLSRGKRVRSASKYRLLLLRRREPRELLLLLLWEGLLPLLLLLLLLLLLAEAVARKRVLIVYEISLPSEHLVKA